jgi:TolB-like protein
VGAAEALPLPLPDKPSIAVLPFANMSGDPEQEYFADGMVEEITTAISRLPWLFVIARNSAFTYKGRQIDVKQVARELGVRYVLEGSVRKAGNRVRITGQLIDTATGAHIWAERFDGALDDVFELQDQVASNVVGAIEPKLIVAEAERAIRKPTESLGAYDLYLRAFAEFQKFTEPGRDTAIALLTRALALDPSYAPAAAAIGWCRLFQAFTGSSGFGVRGRGERAPGDPCRRDGEGSARRAVDGGLYAVYFHRSACDGGGHDRSCPRSQSQFGQCLVRSRLGRGDAGSSRPGNRGIATRDTPQPARSAALAVYRRNFFCAYGGAAL